MISCPGRPASFVSGISLSPPGNMAPRSCEAIAGRGAMRNRTGPPGRARLDRRHKEASFGPISCPRPARACLRVGGACGKNRPPEGGRARPILYCPGICCRSSVVEHSLGKGEVDSSILSGSTMISLMFSRRTRYCVLLTARVLHAQVLISRRWFMLIWFARRTSVRAPVGCGRMPDAVSDTAMLHLQNPITPVCRKHVWILCMLS
jgi:hypothetical protein